ncbi:hypothetical protein [Pseudomonas sp.]|uniref:hypothetical protein n=1 Tax=Pseudomonas sp. TaxID=306 RepID=UPI003FD83E94
MTTKQKLDIVLCSSDNCPKRSSCTRSLQEPRAIHQAYLVLAVSVPRASEGICKFYIEEK